MGKVMINAGGGGGGVSSDETNVVASQVLSGKTYLGADTNDEVGTGTMPNIAAVDTAKSTSFSNGTLHVRMSNGAHITNSSSGYPEVTVPGQTKTATPGASAVTVTPDANKVLEKVTVNAVSGLSAGNIKNGAVVGGVKGTYKGLGNATAAQVLSGRTFSTASLSNATGTMKNHTGTPNKIQYRRIQNNRFEVAVDVGYHACNWAGNSYEYMTFSEVASTLGLTAAKLAQGQKVCGLTGTYKGLGNATAADVVSGKKFSTATLSNATGTMGTMAGGTYTPSTSKQTISCSGKKMTSNIIINAIPSTYIDMGSNGSWTVFNQGTFSGGFGFVPYYLNTSTMQQSDYSVIYENKTESNAKNFDSDFNGETKYCVNVIRAIPQALVLNRAVNLTSLSRIRVEWYMYLPRNTSSDFNLLLINKNKQSISKTFYEDRTSAWSSRSFYVYSFISYDISDYSGEYFIGFQSNRSSVGISQIIFVK